MKMLLKYEFRKSWSAKLIALGLFAVLEAALLLGLLFDHSRTVGFATGLLVFAAFVVPMAIGIASVVILHRDMNSKQGYMLFMTPRNCYQILGAKVIENGVSVLLAGVAIALLGVLDVTLVFARYNLLDDLWAQLSKIIEAFTHLSIDRTTVLLFFFSVLCSWLCTVNIAYFADILSSSILRGKKFSGLVAFIFFIVISLLVSRLGFFAFESLNRKPVSYLLADAVYSLVCAVALYFGAAAIMDRNLNV
ncbi:MAG: hypothetical protein IKS31_02125 [Clostridia bacterium]|nr:hypothetical protein [Clostridia bacterium]